MKFAIIALTLVLFFGVPVRPGGWRIGWWNSDKRVWRAMPNASISVKDVSTGLARTATTNEAGVYNVPAFLPETLK